MLYETTHEPDSKKNNTRLDTGKYATLLSVRLGFVIITLHLNKQWRAHIISSQSWI